ncbi:hypothetical protein TNCV_3559521 [Trichonephila clavipes]|uniref:Uncharacterized protein n=1 Tax=Trichonephila clavipes TaxID=2585209 RepID=A0A8X6WDK4_TRICX|nr:hypothetical protein TNCV_3559521 [Trichonephila clavipes]
MSDRGCKDFILAALACHCKYIEHVKIHAKIVEVEIGGVTIYRPFGEFHRANSYCMGLKAKTNDNDRRTSGPCHNGFRGSQSDYARKVA